MAGLSLAEAAQRLATNGPNALEEAKRPGPLRLIAAQFKGLITWLLIAAGVASALLGEWIDAGAIFAIVLLNAAIGFYQELRAEKSIAALKKLTAPEAKLRRDGALTSVPATTLVVGDILELEAGAVVAADARVLSASSLQCVESSLTGESEGVAKDPAVLAGPDVPLGDRHNMVFMGTSVAAGSGLAVVVATGMRSELGRIASLLKEAGREDSTPLQKKLDAVGRILIWAALGIVVVLGVLGFARGAKALDLFMGAVGLAVAAVPEGLPAVVTVALSRGVLRLARSGALVRRLSAVETLGSTSVICTDKTGTLTVGEMTVRRLLIDDVSCAVSGEGYGPEGAVQAEQALDPAALLELGEALVGCSNTRVAEEGGLWRATGDPTEAAMFVAGRKTGAAAEPQPQVLDLPFDSERKRHSIVRQRSGGGLRVYTSGGTGALLERCTQLYTRAGLRPLNPADREHLLEQTSVLAKDALRVLALARRDLEGSAEGLRAEDVERELVFLGLVGMHDPPRAEAKASIETCKAAGIRVVMITGDHPVTANAIAAELGVAGAPPVSGVELDALSDAALEQKAAETTVYARVTAEHKLRIVRALKAGGRVVAMTGDGVNDAPAIRGADIGIAMGAAGTDVTKEAADLILTDDNFSTIVAAVEEGRGIYDNIQKTLQYLLAGNTGELLLVATCVVIGLPLPLLPIHLLWINLVTDGLPAICLATDPVDETVMLRQPRPRAERIVSGSFLLSMGLTGLLTGGVALSAFLYGLENGGEDLARTYAFTVLVFAELLRSFGARSATTPVWRMAHLTNLNLLIVVALTGGFQVWMHHSAVLQRFLKVAPVSFSTGLVLLGLGVIPLLVLELVKVLSNHLRQKPAALPPLALPDPSK